MGIFRRTAHKIPAKDLESLYDLNIFLGSLFLEKLPNVSLLKLGMHWDHVNIVRGG